MSLGMRGHSVLILGPGDYLDRAITRVLAAEGAATWTTFNGQHHEDLSQHGTDVPHWSSQEDDIHGLVPARIRKVMGDAGHPPSAAVIHVDVLSSLSVRGSVGWWRYCREVRFLLNEIAHAAMYAVPAAGGGSVVLVYQLNANAERRQAVRWAQQTMSAISKRAHADANPSLRVNAVFIEADARHPEAAYIIALLCSPIAQSVSGALIPIGENAYVPTLLSDNETSPK